MLYREGDISLIESDIITNTTDETLTERNTVSSRIFQRAGPDLYDEILNDNRGKLYSKLLSILCTTAVINMIYFLLFIFANLLFFLHAQSVKLVKCA